MLNFAGYLIFDYSFRLRRIERQRIAFNSSNNYISVYIELSCNVVFTIDIMIKIFIRGFYKLPGAFLRNPWELLNFVVLISSYYWCFYYMEYFDDNVSEFSKLQQTYVFKVLRTIKMLRLFRILKYIPPLKKQVH